MTKMNELYEKVSADSTLQVKFAEIMKEAEAAGEKATNEKLTSFAKEAGYDITVEEMQTFLDSDVRWHRFMAGKIILLVIKRWISCWMHQLDCRRSTMLQSD